MEKRGRLRRPDRSLYDTSRAVDGRHPSRSTRREGSTSRTSKGPETRPSGTCASGRDEELKQVDAPARLRREWIHRRADRAARGRRRRAGGAGGSQRGRGGRARGGARAGAPGVHARRRRRARSRAVRHPRGAQLRGPVFAHGRAAGGRLPARARALPGHHGRGCGAGGAGRARRGGARGGHRALARSGFRRRAVGLSGGARRAAPSVGHPAGPRVLRRHAHVAWHGADHDRERPPRRAGAARRATGARAERLADAPDRLRAGARRAHARSRSPGATSRLRTTPPASPTSRSTSPFRWRCGRRSARRARSDRCSPRAPSSVRSRRASGAARPARPPTSAPVGAATCGRRRATPRARSPWRACAPRRATS